MERILSLAAHRLAVVEDFAEQSVKSTGATLRQAS